VTSEVVVDSCVAAKWIIPETDSANRQPFKLAMRIRRKKRTAVAVHRRAEKLLEVARSPGCQDDPAWLKQRAEAMIQFAARRRNAHFRKIEEIRMSQRRKSTQ
jgi:hypothetical protein